MVAVLQCVPFEKQIVAEELASHCYSSTAYSLAKLMAELPLIWIQAGQKITIQYNVLYVLFLCVMRYFKAGMQTHPPLKHICAVSFFISFLDCFFALSSRERGDVLESSTTVIGT
jgi:hypothetical protein